MHQSRILRVPRIAFDEAGNTGANLLDKDQPIFVLASVLVTPEIAAIGSCEKELKFSKLRHSTDGRRLILDVLNNDALRPDSYLLSGFHKKFMAVVKIVDLLYEPLAHASGVDLYERGANLAMANLLFNALPTFTGPSLFERLLDDFVAMVRDPSNQKVGKFYTTAESAYRAASADDLKSELGALLATRVVVETDRSSFNPNALDPAIPSFFLHASRWTGRLGVPFNIIHDDSKPIRSEQVVLEAMMSTTEPAKVIGYDRRTMSFPLTATGISLCDSATEPALQVADVIASAASYALRNSKPEDSDDFAESLLATRVLGDGNWEPVWPELKIDPVELGTEGPAPRVNPCDRIGAYVSKRLGGIPPVGQRRKGTEKS